MMLLLSVVSAVPPHLMVMLAPILIVAMIVVLVARKCGK